MQCEFGRHGRSDPFPRIKAPKPGFSSLRVPFYGSSCIVSSGDVEMTCESCSGAFAPLKPQASPAGDLGGPSPEGGQHKAEHRLASGHLAGHHKPFSWSQDSPPGAQAAPSGFSGQLQYEVRSSNATCTPKLSSTALTI